MNVLFPSCETMTSIDIILCDQCDNLMRWREIVDGVKYLRCPVCGALKDLRGDEAEIEEEKKDDGGKYDFANKKASRLIIKRLLETCKKEGLVKPFEHQKVLILTHVKGHDIEQILLPLGYKKENIWIIERERDVYDKICANPFFEGCTVKNMNLEKFNDRSLKFDLLYLDFKSNISSDVVNIITKLLSFNTCNGSAVYINIQMARETRKITEEFEKMHERWIGRLEREVKEKKESNGVGEMVTKVAAATGMISKTVESMKNNTFTMEKMHEYFGDEGIRNITEAMVNSWDANGRHEIKVKLGNGGEFILNMGKTDKKSMTFDYQGEKLVFNKNDDLDTFGNKLDSFKENVIEETGIKKMLESQTNWHLHRQKTVEWCVKSALNAFLDHPEKFIKNFNKKPAVIGVNLDVFDVNEMNDREKNMITTVRYMARTLIPVRFTQFIYQTSSKNRTPFLNTFFVLKNYPSVLRTVGYSDLSTMIGDVFVIFWLHSRGEVPKRSTTLSIQNFLFLDQLVKGKKMTAEFVSNFDRLSQNDVRNVFNETKNVYVDLVKNGLLHVNKSGLIDLKMVNSDWSNIVYRGNMKKYIQLANSGAFKKKKCMIDCSTTILKVYLTISLLREIENEVEKSYKIHECEIVDVDEETDVEAYVDELFPTILDPIEPVIQVAREFKKAMSKRLKALKELKLWMSNMEKVMMGAGINPKEVYQEYELVRYAILQMFDVPKKKVKELEDDQLATVIRKFVAKHGDVVASKLAMRINDHVKKKHGHDPGVTTSMVSAHKYWHRVRNQSPDPTSTL